jgi:hypothetical protein
MRSGVDTLLTYVWHAFVGNVILKSAIYAHIQSIATKGTMLGPLIEPRRLLSQYKQRQQSEEDKLRH